MTHIEDGDDGEQQDLINDMCAICAELGWILSLPESDEYIMVSGLIIGNSDYVIKNSNIAYGENNSTEKRYSLYGMDENGNMIELMAEMLNENNGMVH